MPEIAQTLEQEIAKTQNELRCAERDLAKAQKRMAFCLTAVHSLQTRDIQE